MSGHTKDDLLHQILVAFGQGTGSLRVSHTATRALTRRYGRMITEKRVVERWDRDAAQALERIRAVGRLAASLATQDARTVVEDRDVKEAMPKVESRSGTDICSS